MPADTYVFNNLVNLHLSSDIWGSDASVWRPDRWIIKNDGTGEESLLQPPPGTYMPWVMGPRVCPGKKFAQVEFVAVLGTLFQNHRVMPAPQAGETEETASKRIIEAVEDSEIVLTIKVKNPEKIRVRWEADA